MAMRKLVGVVRGDVVDLSPGMAAHAFVGVSGDAWAVTWLMRQRGLPVGPELAAEIDERLHAVAAERGHGTTEDATKAIGVQMLVASSDARCWVLDGARHVHEVLEDEVAIGSGGETALGALVALRSCRSLVVDPFAAVGSITEADPYEVSPRRRVQLAVAAACARARWCGMGADDVAEGEA
jgi:hypothetical protein